MKTIWFALLISACGGNVSDDDPGRPGAVQDSQSSKLAACERVVDRWVGGAEIRARGLSRTLLANSTYWLYECDGEGVYPEGAEYMIEICVQADWSRIVDLDCVAETPYLFARGFKECGAAWSMPNEMGPIAFEGCNKEHPYPETPTSSCRQLMIDENKQWVDWIITACNLAG